MSLISVVPKERGDPTAERVLAELEKSGWRAFRENFHAGRISGEKRGPRFAASRRFAKNTLEHLKACFSVCRFPRSRVEIVRCARILGNAAFKFGILFGKETRVFWFPEDNYNYGKAGRTVSVIVHILVIAILFSAGVATKKIVSGKKQEQLTQIDISPYVLPPAENQSGGGGGGGDRDKLAASKGALPKLSREQITPPAVVVRNENPKLAVDPSVVVPPELKLPQLGQLGDPLSGVLGPPSSGTGSGSGIGSGSGGGVGSGRGPGVGPGWGGGIGGGPYRVGGGVSAPRAIYSPDPEYSEEARKAKYQGTVVLWMVVGPDGRPRDIRVARSVGMGLDEKAIEAVRTWRFEPARKDGQPVAVQINVEVSFRLY